MHRHLIPKFVGAVVLLTALGGGAAYAFTASNIVGSSYAGQGNGVVSGYVVSNISYGVTWVANGINPGDPQDDITSVSFTLNNPADFVAIDVWGTSNPNGTGTPNTLVGGGGGQINNPLYPGSPCSETGGLYTCKITPIVAYTTAPTPSDISSIDVQASE
jgi:hypothetical protein